MTSIYQKALGSDFAKLHPQIQRRFNFSSEDHVASVGRGVMEKIWSGKSFIRPFLHLGATRHCLFPDQGTNIPFMIENYAYKDCFGRETVTFVRSFQFDSQARRFDATMIYSEERERIVDYLGTHQHLAVDIDLSVTENGGIQLRSNEQRFYEGWLDFRFPMSLSGYAEVCEWYDDEEGAFKIKVNVNNPWLGPLFGYHGTFQVENLHVTADQVPRHVKPVRQENRE